MLDDYKRKFLNETIQFVIFDDEGFCLESDDVIFKLNTSKESLFERFLFLESYKDLFVNMEVGETYEFPCVNIEQDEQKLYFDFLLERIAHKNGKATLWILQDFTRHYEHLIDIQQERNDNAISGEYHEMREKAINLERDLLQFQNDELSRLQKFKTQFYARLSHELRTPLQSITGLSTLINEVQLQDKREEYLFALKATSKHLLSIVNDVIDLSKIEEGKILIHPKDSDILEILNEIDASFRFIAEEKGLSFNLYKGERFPQFAFIDAIKLKQILYNLLGNALKFTSTGGISLSVSIAAEQPDLLLFTVTDTGIGVPQDKIERIFNPYEQAASSLYGGSGLGLSIVKQLTDLMGGKIELFSEEGIGTTVNVSIPFKNVNAPLEQEHQKETQKLSIKNVLIADDDNISQKVLATVLSNWGIKTEVASNGKEFISKAQNKQFDLFIIDYHMPEMDGLQVVNFLKSNYAFNDVPVFMLTGEITPKVKEKFTQHGITQVINKPVEPEKLYMLIAQIPTQIKKEESVEIDLTYLFEITNNNKQLVKHLISDFMNNAPLDVISLRKYYDAGDLDKLKQVLHKSKTNMKYVGLHELHQEMEGLELKIKNKISLDNSERIIKLIEKTVKLAVEKLAVSYKSL
ncbi:ATP-binding protein [Chondrinema litorale]|uniref:ATP-binding protein n=1 Tax=Chondrinema litorale TaxID=2994555 RepID=UPI002543895D|nr:ATP-binding protein [Chondrinema litorale]UZR95423.1 ATP-binding protein [Chondrinema litorale]